MQSHIRKVYACLAVTCHLHFWQNDRGLLCATAVTQGWNRYQNFLSLYLPPPHSVFSPLLYPPTPHILFFPPPFLHPLSYPVFFFFFFSLSLTPSLLSWFSLPLSTPPPPILFFSPLLYPPPPVFLSLSLTPSLLSWFSLPVSTPLSYPGFLSLCIHCFFGFFLPFYTGSFQPIRAINWLLSTNQSHRQAGCNRLQASSPCSAPPGEKATRTALTCREVAAPIRSPRLCATSEVWVASVRNMTKRRKSVGWDVIQ